MRNPLRNTQISMWMEQTIANWRYALRRVVL